MESIASQNIVESVGNTPLIELSSFSTKNIKFYAKLEWYNPFGSVKDRAAYWMIKDAEKKGLLKKEKSVIIEPTSGNTGIALAGIATSLGYRVEIVIPEKVSEETKKILRDLGALLHETSDDLCPRVGAGTDQSIALAKAIAKPRPDVYYMPNQYENDANFLAHYDGTWTGDMGTNKWQSLSLLYRLRYRWDYHWCGYLPKGKESACQHHCNPSAAKSFAPRFKEL